MGAGRGRSPLPPQPAPAPRCQGDLAPARGATWGQINNRASCRPPFLVGPAFITLEGAHSWQKPLTRFACYLLYRHPLPKRWGEHSRIGNSEELTSSA